MFDKAITELFVILYAAVGSADNFVGYFVLHHKGNRPAFRPQNLLPTEMSLFMNMTSLISGPTKTKRGAPNNEQNDTMAQEAGQKQTIILVIDYPSIVFGVNYHSKKSNLFVVVEKLRRLLLIRPLAISLRTLLLHIVPLLISLKELLRLIITVSISLIALLLMIEPLESRVIIPLWLILLRLTGHHCCFWPV